MSKIELKISKQTNHHSGQFWYEVNELKCGSSLRECNTHYEALAAMKELVKNEPDKYFFDEKYREPEQANIDKTYLSLTQKDKISVIHFHHDLLTGRNSELWFPVELDHLESHIEIILRVNRIGNKIKELNKLDQPLGEFTYYELIYHKY